ncbi:hypothetical protein ACRZ5O_06580 [Pseudomonas protegens]|uniref:hypothetical protein n=1 Tax=Pseudomonas protegens TaxID=380021 RepID=UPI003FD7FEF9
MKTNYFNAYTQALGALALIPIYLTSPGTVSKATLICAAARGASKEGLTELIRLKLQPTEVGAGEAST